jgi:hypothetical protein
MEYPGLAWVTIVLASIWMGGISAARLKTAVCSSMMRKVQVMMGTKHHEEKAR